MLKLERDFGENNNNNSNNNLPKISSSRRRETVDETMTRKAQTPDSARIFGTPVKYHTPDVKSYQGEIELGDEVQKTRQKEKLEALMLRKKLAGTSPLPLRSSSSSASRNRRTPLVDISRSVFDVSQQLAAELEKADYDHQEENNNTFTHHPKINPVNEEAVETTREMSAFKKKILAHQQQQQQQELSYHQQQQQDKTTNGVTSTTALSTARDSSSGATTTTTTGIDSSRPPKQIFLNKQQQYHHQNQNNQSLNNKIDNSKTTTISTTGNLVLPTAIESAIDEDFCRQVGLTPLGGVKSKSTPTALRRPASSNGSNRTYISKEIEKALREKEQREAKRELLEYSEEKRGRNTSFKDSDEHFTKSRMEIEKEINELNRDSLRVEKHEKKNQFAQHSHDAVQVQKKKEVGNLSSLASTLCGPGSLLARKLSTK